MTERRHRMSLEDRAAKLNEWTDAYIEVYETVRRRMGLGGLHKQVGARAATKMTLAIIKRTWDDG